MALSKNKKKVQKLPIVILVVVVLLVIIVLAIVLQNKSQSNKNTDLMQNISDGEDENVPVIEQAVQDIKETIKEETCEEKVRKLTPDTIILQKNTLDPQWSVDSKNTSLNKWTDGTVLVPTRFIRYQLGTGSVYKAEKPLITSTETHYFIYSTPKLIFEINPTLKENPDSLIVEEGYGGRQFFKEAFLIEDIGIVSCKSTN